MPNVRPLEAPPAAGPRQVLDEPVGHEDLRVVGAYLDLLAGPARQWRSPMWATAIARTMSGVWPYAAGRPPRASRTPAMPLTIRPGNRPTGMNQARGSATWITPPARNSRRTSAAALASRRPQGPESAAAHAAEAARDAAARAPPAIAAVCNVRDPGPARPASRATAAVNRASATVEMAWPAALSR